jgi:hypothetical protein
MPSAFPPHPSRPTANDVGAMLCRTSDRAASLCALDARCRPVLREMEGIVCKLTKYRRATAAGWLFVKEPLHCISSESLLPVA